MFFSPLCISVCVSGTGCHTEKVQGSRYGFSDLHPVSERPVQFSYHLCGRAFRSVPLLMGTVSPQSTRSRCPLQSALQLFHTHTVLLWREGSHQVHFGLSWSRRHPLSVVQCEDEVCVALTTPQNERRLPNKSLEIWNHKDGLLQWWLQETLALITSTLLL